MFMQRARYITSTSLPNIKEMFYLRALQGTKLQISERKKRERDD